MKSVLKYIVGILTVLILGAAGYFGTDAFLSRSGDQTDGTSRQQQPTRVGIALAELRNLEETVSAVGTLMPLRYVDLRPDMPGRITDIAASSGQRVDQGDLIVQLDDRAERAAVLDAESTLKETELEFRRVETLADTNAAAEARLEQSRASFRRAEAALMSARADLEDRTITASFAGTLGLIDIDIGAFLSRSDTVTRLSDLSVMEVSVSLPERYFDSIKPGLRLIVETPAYPDESFQGRVTVRASEIALATRSFDLRAEIDNSDRRLVGGMFANSSLVLRSYQGLAVPDDAIISEGLSTYVYVADGETARRTGVEVGQLISNESEIRSGLNAGDRVVVSGWDQLSDGALIAIDDAPVEKPAE